MEKYGSYHKTELSMRIILLLTILLYSTLSYFSQPVIAEEASDKKIDEATQFPILVSLINLIATPERYDKKFIDVTGFATIELENMSLCLSKESLSTSECIWIELYEPEKDIEISTEREKHFKQFHRKVVNLQGTFDMKNTGHFGFWPAGAIKNIKYSRAVTSRH